MSFSCGELKMERTCFFSLVKTMEPRSWVERGDAELFVSVRVIPTGDDDSTVERDGVEEALIVLLHD